DWLLTITIRLPLRRSDFLQEDEVPTMNHPFDEFSKSLSQESVPRRESLRRLGLVFVGAVLIPLALGLETASANPETRRWQTRRFRPASVKPSKGGSGQDPCQAFCRCR